MMLETLPALPISCWDLRRPAAIVISWPFKLYVAQSPLASHQNMRSKAEYARRV